MYKSKKNKEAELNEKIKAKYPRIRGMKDILFDEYRYFDLVIKKAADLARAYGFNRVEMPILERTELYERTSGKTSDIVTKEMYAFVDKGGEKVALRPEATPSLVRAYIEHGLFNKPQPVKTFWAGPLFRYDRPQSGRYRQHNQFNLDIFGEESPIADVLLLLIVHTFFKELQLNIEIQINSIGCSTCRVEYIEKLKEYFKPRAQRSKLCNDCKKRVTKNPLRILDCKEASCTLALHEAPHIVDSLDDECRKHFVKVLEYLDELNVPYNLNPFLVRGLDYYTRTVFEILPMDAIEISNGKVQEKARQLSLGGGGRYDGLIELLGGRHTPSVGFGIGIERVILKIKESNIALKSESDKKIFLAQIGEQARRKAFVLFDDLRKADFNISQSFTRDSLRAQLEDANKEGAKYTLILGQKEVMDNTVLIRDMDSGVQEVIDFKKIVSELTKRLDDK